MLKNDVIKKSYFNNNNNVGFITYIQFTFYQVLLKGDCVYFAVSLILPWAIDK
jgi:hypothetical protein